MLICFTLTVTFYRSSSLYCAYNIIIFIDVFENTHGEVSLKIGLKFLRAMSANPSMYEDIEVRKKSLSIKKKK
jgi:hypothetical protein